MLMHDVKHRIAEVLENQQPMLTPEWEAHINITLCHSMTDLRGHGGRVVTLSPPTSAAGVRSPSWP